MKDYEIANKHELIIKLLASIAFPPEKVREIVVGKSENASSWIKAYNLCDGEHPKQSEIATKAGVHKGDLSVALKKWEQIGIIFKVKKGNGKICYKAVTYLKES